MLHFDWSQYRGNLTWLPQRTIFLSVVGSHAYGLNTPESDVDIKGITIPTKEYFHGFSHIFEQAESKEPDLTIYDIRKFFKLAADANPNILEVLWTNAEHWYDVPWFHFGKRLIEQRNKFLSRKVRHTFSGYAMAQLKRIRGHRKWLLDPPTDKPHRKTYGLPETSLLSADILGAMEAVSQKNPEAMNEFPAHMMTLYHQERAYQNALREWQQYENWKTNRNPKRAALEAKIGFDGKHASHLVRLLKMGREILAKGEVIVNRPDREEILAIRNGAWGYDRLVAWAEQEDAALGEIEKESPLPHSPDRKALDVLCQEIVEGALHTAS